MSHIILTSSVTLPSARCISNCCCLTHLPKTSQLKTVHIISQFLWNRNLGAASLGPLLHAVSQGCSQGVSRGSAVSSEGSTRVGSGPGLPCWLLAAFISSWAEDLSGSRTVDGRPHSVPCPVDLSHVAVCFSKKAIERDC